MTKLDCEQPPSNEDESWNLDHNEYGEPSYYGRTFGRYSNRAQVSRKPSWSAEKHEAEQFMQGMEYGATTGVGVLGALLLALWPKGARRR